MKINKTSYVTLLAGISAAVLLLLALHPIAAAEDEAPQKQPVKAEKKDKPEVVEKVQIGTIASSGSFGQSHTTNVQTDGAAPGDEANVISGGVSRSGRDQCTATMTNTSQTNTYSVSFKVVGRNEGGSKTVEKSYSATLKPKQRITRDLRCGDANMEVVLQSAKKIGKSE